MILDMQFAHFQFLNAKKEGRVFSSLKRTITTTTIRWTIAIRSWVAKLNLSDNSLVAGIILHLQQNWRQSKKRQQPQQEEWKDQQCWEERWIQSPWAINHIAEILHGRSFFRVQTFSEFRTCDGGWRRNTSPYAQDAPQTHFLVF